MKSFTQKNKFIYIYVFFLLIFSSCKQKKQKYALDGRALKVEYYTNEVIDSVFTYFDNKLVERIYYSNNKITYYEFNNLFVGRQYKRFYSEDGCEYYSDTLEYFAFTEKMLKNDTNSPYTVGDTIKFIAFAPKVPDCKTEITSINSESNNLIFENDSNINCIYYSQYKTSRVDNLKFCFQIELNCQAMNKVNKFIDCSEIQISN